MWMFQQKNTVVNTLYVVGTPTCTVQCEVLMWGQNWVEVELCRKHMLSVSQREQKTVQVLVTAVK